MSNINEIKPLVDALDFIKFTDRAIGNRFVAALKALELDLQEAEGGPYEPGSDCEEALNALSVEIADALEKIADEEEELETKEVVAEVELEDELLDEEEDELEDMTESANDPLLDDDVLDTDRIEEIKPES